MDGTHEFVEFDSDNFAGCVGLYGKLAASSFDIDLVDLRAVDQDDGSIEYVSCIYDSGTGLAMGSGSLDINANFSSFAACIGDILIFRTLAPGESFDDMTDRVVPLGMGAQECVKVVQTFRERLAEFMVEEKCTMDLPFKTLFPFLMRDTVEGKKRYYEVRGFNIGANSIEIDLLTYKPKRRRLAPIAASGSGMKAAERLFREATSKPNQKRFCVVCKEVTRFSCSRCKAYYACGSEACKRPAWKIHKKDCKTVN